ncbi:hypothetical protein B0A48_06209 [Cryoendolithus antarcticus]|uniref:Uncharacterized protein n=1 Tax=Cryoendolithus antarcticus TaxID=1507870 RepID=A0A1V8TAE7_9PEZI|nr:hypothetical protein B0A48_06209 [Cryoendolithus antarcticus]
MAGLVFITASPRLKPLNRALTLLRDWEYNEGEPGFCVVTTRNAYELETTKNPLALTEVPLPDPHENAWTAASLDDIEAYMRDVHRCLPESRFRVRTTLFLVIDDEGLEADEVVLLRVPMEEAHTMFVNLDVANMSFEDFADGDEGADEDGWWVYAGVGGPDLFEESLEAREVEMERDFDNAWVNASLADIEAYMLDTHRLIARYNAPRINTSLFLVLDSAALAKDEIVLYQRFYDFASGAYLDKFKITRLPLEQAHTMHANLDINNMEFESYVEWDRKRGPRGKGWMVYRGLVGSEMSAKVVAKREAELERLRVLDLVN